MSLYNNFRPSRNEGSDETATLLDNEDFTDQEETDSRRPSESHDLPANPRDSAQAQSDRIRSRYLSHILTTSNSERQ